MEEARALALLQAFQEFLEDPTDGQRLTAIKILTAEPEPDWVESPTAVALALAGGNKTLWIRLLSHLQGGDSYLFGRFKHLSPFASFPLLFNVERTSLAREAQEALELNRFSAQHDEFAFLIVNGQLVPIWIRERNPKEGALPRKGPLVDVGKRVDITA